MKNKYILLSHEQVFGENKIDVIKTVGTTCKPTTFAKITGAKTNEDGNCHWFLSSAAGCGDVCVADGKGERSMAYADSYGSVRPVFECGDIEQMSVYLVKEVSGIFEAEMGEYPQDEVDKKLALRLENEFAIGRLKKTGKKYGSVYEEYHLEDSKFIRMPHEDDAVWIRVSPIKWFYDPKSSLLVSKRTLISGQIYSSGKYYDGEFENTVMYAFLNDTFANDIIPSTITEMTEEEKKEYEARMIRAAKRRNPYGLTFGEVSEEDIIRGAIESDVAVFLHGPSSEGKSARVKQIDPTCEIIYLRNATPDSLNGRSVYNQSTGEMIDIPPTWFKKLKSKCEAEPDKLHVVFFDEINNALPSIQGMAFNIVLDREVNGIWKLPENARVVAAGNDMQDSLAAHQLAQPFFNRFAHVYINTTTDKWLKWARENNIHPAIYTYIAFKRGETLRSPYDGKKPNADPRKWEMASKMLYATGQPEMLRSLIGEDITDEFVKFCSQSMITLEDILNGDYTDEEIRNMNTSERYATTIGLSLAADEHLDIVRGFISKLGEEFRALFDSFIQPEGK